MFGEWLRRIFRKKPVEIPQELEDALTERTELLNQKDRVLVRFRKAHDALSDRRRTNRGHDPERRGINAQRGI